MKRITKTLLVAVSSFMMIVFSFASAYAVPDVDTEQIKNCILTYFKPIYNSLLADSATNFTKDDYPTVESYLVAKSIESKRDWYLIDYDGGITNVNIKYVKLIDDTIKVSDKEIAVDGVIDYIYCFSNYETESAEKYHFVISTEGDEYKVKDVVAFDEGLFQANRKCIPYWEEICKEYGDEWEYEAINRIVDSKKIDLDEMIDIQEVEPEPEPIQSRALENNLTATVPYDSSAAATYAYKTAPYDYDPNYIFCSVDLNCTNFVGRCVWAGYGGTAGYTLPSSSSQYDNNIIALMNRVQNDYRMAPGSWYEFIMSVGIRL